MHDVVGKNGNLTTRCSVALEIVSKLLSDSLKLSKLPADFEMRLESLPPQVKTEVGVMIERIGKLEASVNKYQISGGNGVLKDLYGVLVTIDFKMKAIEQTKTVLNTVYDEGNKQRSNVVKKVGEICILVESIMDNRLTIRKNEMFYERRRIREGGLAGEIGPGASSSTSSEVLPDPAVSSSITSSRAVLLLRMRQSLHRRSSSQV
jgi:hypothetical protein